MDTLMALQNLAVTVNGLKESVNLESARVTAVSSENIHAASIYHSRFGQLLNKYSVFANEYKSQLANLHEALLNDISIKQKERDEKLELLSCKSSHSNLEIVENVEQTEYFSEHSVNMNSINLNLSSNDDSDFEHSLSWIDAIKSEIKPMQSKKSIPISPKQSSKKHKRKNKGKKSNDRNNKNQKKVKNADKPGAVSKATPKPTLAKVAKKTKTQKVSKPLIVRTVIADIERKEEKNDEKKTSDKRKEGKYVYKTKKVWDEVYKHTTMVFVGNIPLNTKLAAVQFFIMKQFKVTLRQIVNTMLYQARSGFNQYALVMFRSDVPMDHITKCMDTINSDNAKIKEDKKATEDAMHRMNKNKNKGKSIRPSANAVKTSWQTRVFVKYQDPEYHYSYYQNEDEMYNDPRARHELFIRNFDILDKKFYNKFTQKLSKFGDLYEDIYVNIDHHGNPYCIVTFKYKNNAIYLCNSDVYFGGKRLEIRYSNKISYLDDLNKHQYHFKKIKR